MSETGIAPGWYDDPDRPGTHRWWDGRGWTEVRHDPYAAVPPPRAPEGTRWNTVWVWLVVVAPVVGYLPLVLIDVSGFLAASAGGRSEEARRAFLSFFSSFLLVAVVQWVFYGLTVLFAWLDHRELRRRGIPRPFHWAWAFLFSIVYVIGRSVVVERRTGRGYAPIWAQAAAFVVTVGIFILLMVQMMTTMLQVVPYPGTTY